MSQNKLIILQVAFVKNRKKQENTKQTNKTQPTPMRMSGSFPFSLLVLVLTQLLPDSPTWILYLLVLFSVFPSFIPVVTLALVSDYNMLLICKVLLLSFYRNLPLQYDCATMLKLCLHASVLALHAESISDIIVILVSTGISWDLFKSASHSDGTIFTSIACTGIT